MMYTIIDFFYKEPLLIIIILCFFLSRFVSKYKYYRYGQITTKDTTDDILKYIDKYYIKNLFFTSLAVASYFSFYIGLMVYLRMSILSANSNKESIFPIEAGLFEIKYSVLLELITHYIIFIFTIISLKILLDLLFFDNIIRLHLYLKTTSWYLGGRAHLTLNLHYHFLGKIYLFLYNITKLRPMPNLDSPLEDYFRFNLYNPIYENENIQKLSFFFVNLAKKYRLVLWIFIFLKYILRWLYRYFNFFRFLPYMHHAFFFIAMFYDFIHLKIYYTFYAFFPYYIMVIIFQFIKFIETKSPIFDDYISKYFYENTLDYGKQRALLYNKPEVLINLLFKSRENKNLLINIDNKSLLIYLINNFKESDDEEEIINKHLKSMYRRFLIISLFIIIYIYLILERNTFLIKIPSINIIIPVVYLLLPIFMLTIIFSNKIFKSTQGEDDDFSEYIYNKHYKKLFWIFITLQAFIFWIIIGKTTLFIMMNETLWECWGIRIIKHYTIDDKIKYFYDHLELYIKMHRFDEDTTALFKSYIEEINIKNFIDENISIETLRIFIEDLGARYNIAIETFLSLYIEKMERMLFVRTIMDAVSNITNLLVFWRFFIKYADAFHMMIESPNIRIIKLIHGIIKILRRY